MDDAFLIKFKKLSGTKGGKFYYCSEKNFINVKHNKKTRGFHKSNIVMC